jgi:X-X-X-Leu-X-X-Gly heptad repeat protein
VTIRLSLTFVAIVSTIACGSSKQAETEKAAKDVQEGAAQMQKAAEQMGQASQQSATQMAQGMQQMAQGFQQMAQGSTKAVDFEQLVAAIPTLEGWTRSEPKGEQVSIPFSTSQAEATYRKDDSRIEIKIVDAALNQVILAPVTMFMNSGYAERSSDGFKRAAKVGAFPGYEEWNSDSKHGEVTAVVNNRLIVTGKGDDVADLSIVRKAVESVNFGKLGAIK